MVQHGLSNPHADCEFLRAGAHPTNPMDYDGLKVTLEGCLVTLCRVVLLTFHIFSWSWIVLTSIWQSAAQLLDHFLGILFLLLTFLMDHVHYVHSGIPHVQFWPEDMKGWCAMTQWLRHPTSSLSELSWQSARQHMPCPWKRGNSSGSDFSDHLREKQCKNQNVL